MSNKVKGTIIGILFSFVAAVLWIILYFIGIIAGLAGGLIGILFIIGYRNINKEDYSKYPYIGAIILTLAEILFINLCFAGILLLLSDIKTNEIITSLAIDMLIGYLLSGLVLGFYIHNDFKKNRNNKYIIKTTNSDDNKNLEKENE